MERLEPSPLWFSHNAKRRGLKALHTLLRRRAAYPFRKGCKPDANVYELSTNR
jgi:hypothetical protein